MSAEILVWQCDTRTLNPTIPQRLIDQAMAEDPAAASAEWGGVFRSDLERMFDTVALVDVTPRGRRVLEPVAGVAYDHFNDPSGGRGDSMTQGVAHRNAAGVVILDLIEEVRPPFNPEEVVAQFARTMRRYGITKTTGDAYAGEWVSQAFAKVGIAYAQSLLTRSELYLE